jgi:uncharacterized protein (TIGR00296 family)
MIGVPMFTLEEGTKAVKAARQVIDSHVKGKKVGKLDLPGSFKELGGVFVTINTHPSKDLRGCIGYPEPVLPLEKAIVDAAKSASTRDPRFEPVSPKELERIVVEVSLLTKPAIVEVGKAKEYLEVIKIGRDGLIAEHGINRGLLLPQVPVEWGWDVHEFLDHTCMKAGLPADAWTEMSTRIYSFQAQVFDETEPHGDVVEMPLVGKK